MSSPQALIPLVVTALLSASTAEATEPPRPEAQIRFVQARRALKKPAAPSVGAAKGKRQARPSLPALRFGEVSPYFRVAAGATALRFGPGRATTTLKAGGRYTIALTGGRKPLRVLEDHAPEAGQAVLTFYNLTGLGWVSLEGGPDGPTVVKAEPGASASVTRAPGAVPLVLMVEDDSGAEPLDAAALEAGAVLSLFALDGDAGSVQVARATSRE